jgi:hypothetical protein
MKIGLSKAQAVYLIDYLQHACEVTDERQDDPDFEIPGAVFPVLLRKALKSTAMELADAEALFLAQGIEHVEHLCAQHEDRESSLVGAIAEEVLEKLKAALQEAGIRYEYQPDEDGV